MRVDYGRVSYPTVPFYIREKRDDRLRCDLCNAPSEELYIITCGEYVCEACAKKEFEIPPEDVVCSLCGEDDLDDAFEIDGENYCECCGTERIWGLPRISL